MYGDFLGCTEYPDCDYKEWISFEYGECPNCGSPLRPIETKLGVFLGCTEYPNCNYKEWIECYEGACPCCGFPLVKGTTYYGDYEKCLECGYFEKLGFF